jgi:Flp pilus assembly protein CpaB
MRSRGLVVAIAVVLAVLAAVGVIVYTNSVKTNAVTGSGAASVLVSKQDIAASTPLNPLISQGVFQSITVPKDAVVAGAVTQESELQNQTTSAPIYANEQIPVSRLTTGTGNLLGISEGHVGLGLQIGGPQSVNGYIQNADQVVVYVTFNRGTVVSNQSLKQLLSPAQIQKFYDSIASNGASSSSLASAPALVLPFDFTMTLVRSVKVLSIQNPAVDTDTGRSTSGSSILVLDATPEDAQQIIFASSQGALYLGLLPPTNKDGYGEPAAIGVPIQKVVGVAKP